MRSSSRLRNLPALSGYLTGFSQFSPTSFRTAPSGYVPKGRATSGALRGLVAFAIWAWRFSEILRIPSHKPFSNPLPTPSVFLRLSIAQNAVAAFVLHQQPRRRRSFPRRLRSIRRPAAANVRCSTLREGCPRPSFQVERCATTEWHGDSGTHDLHLAPNDKLSRA